jgi:serine/arginine repetitive matrix protein 2
MALLNALFPAFVYLEDIEDIDPSPYSDGLRESIRFSIFDHLMSRDPFSQEQQQAIQTRLLSWCDMPNYAKAQEALSRYATEFVKLEEVCLDILGAIEQQRLENSAPTSSDSSFFILADTSQGSDTGTTDAKRQSNPGDALRGFLQQDPLVAPPGPPCSLLMGMPGRELTGSRTNGSDFVMDADMPTCPGLLDELSKDQFDEHPLSKNFGWSAAEKASLGLLLPKQISSPSS